MVNSGACGPWSGLGYRDRFGTVYVSVWALCIVMTECWIKEIMTCAEADSDCEGVVEALIGSGPPDYTSE